MSARNCSAKTDATSCLFFPLTAKALTIVFREMNLSPILCFCASLRTVSRMRAVSICPSRSRTTITEGEKSANRKSGSTFRKLGPVKNCALGLRESSVYTHSPLGNIASDRHEDSAKIWDTLQEGARDESSSLGPSWTAAALYNQSSHFGTVFCSQLV